MTLEEFNLTAVLSFVFIVITWYVDCDTFLRSFHNRFFRYSIQTDRQSIYQCIKLSSITITLGLDTKYVTVRGSSACHSLYSQQ